MTSEAPANAAEAGSTGRLARRITGPLLFLFILGDVLGAGIYALMGVLAKDVGGVLWALRQEGWPIPGLDVYVDSTVPLGSGLSSSAAIECAVGSAVAAGREVIPAAEVFFDEVA